MILLAAISFLILASAAVAITRRNLIHAALWLVVSWFGVALFFLWAGAQFIGFVQVLVYVGAVSMIMLFAMLLTRQGRVPVEMLTLKAEKRIASGVLLVSAVFGVIAGCILGTDFPVTEASAASSVTLVRIGESLMNDHAVALLAMGALLTVALIGAVYIASSGEEDAS
ncbi:MAG TPA: NADH-quinone oxidoreductase subunit J [Opitutaceae bacterium]|nr:NADH-quinone oxidoreductase subunit J [Opitutaceae bacterium]